MEKQSLGQPVDEKSLNPSLLRQNGGLQDSQGGGVQWKLKSKELALPNSSQG